MKMDGWHLWFAWYPVVLDDDNTVWLEWIERRLGGWVEGPFGFEQWHYRIPGSSEELYSPSNE